MYLVHQFVFLCMFTRYDHTATRLFILDSVCALNLPLIQDGTEYQFIEYNKKYDTQSHFSPFLLLWVLTPLIQFIHSQQTSTLFPMEIFSSTTRWVLEMPVMRVQTSLSTSRPCLKYRRVKSDTVNVFIRKYCNTYIKNLGKLIYRAKANLTIYRKMVRVTA